MNPTLPCLVALAFATGSTFAAAQAQAQPQQQAQSQQGAQPQQQPAEDVPAVQQPAATGTLPSAKYSSSGPAPNNKPVEFSEQPVASTANNGGEGANAVNPIARTIAADAAFEQSKITVHAIEEGNVLLTGVTPTREQMLRAVDIARQHAGEGKVANAIQFEKFVLLQHPDKPGQLIAPQEENRPEAEQAHAQPKEPSRQMQGQKPVPRG